MIQQLGPYRIERVIGRGGMGTVYAGIDEQTSQRAAIKILSPALAGDESFRVRFEAEIETLKKLKHPNIVELYGYGKWEGHLFYAMQLIEGTNLQDELASGRRFDWRDVSRIGIQVCGALKHAHDHGVIHRDLKPANLLFDSNEDVKLSDFGIAKLFGQTQLTGDGGVLGTADYMAPEQAEGRPATIRSDLYSVGCVMYALLAGRPPLCGSSLPEVIHMVRFDDPLPVRRFAAEAPADLENILDQLLKKDPHERIPTALALSHRLRAMEHALSIPGAAGDDDSNRSSKNFTGRVDGELTIFGTVAELKKGFDPTLADRPTAPMPVDEEGPSGAVITGSPTRVDYENDVDDLMLKPSPDSDGEISPGTFTAIDEEQRRNGHQSETDREPLIRTVVTAVLAFAMLMLLIFAIWKIAQPKSADDLYEQITAQTDLDSTSGLLSIESDVNSFLARFPADRRADEIKIYRDMIELDRLERKLQLRARQRRDNTSILSPAEQIYVEAVQIRQISREEAASKLRAMIELFDGQENLSDEVLRCVELAKRQLDSLNTAIELTALSHRKILEERLQFALEIRQQQPAKSESILQALIELYDGKPWAVEVVSQARLAIQQMPSSNGS